MKVELKVEQVMLNVGQVPVMGPEVLFRDALEAMSKARLGMVLVVDSEERLLGVLTDGDVRRILLRTQKPLAALFMEDVSGYMVESPTTIRPGDRLEDGIELMGEKQIWDLPVVTHDGFLKGLLHLHPAIKILLERK
ncbi:MAG: CBS domain-containing protein [Verrucomicrobiales bacterium]|nr:CBS domain-containing protein [Verrucomicrobiales bacterium]|tara:strand:- start:184 stop:594 length:411 start_codon:yes stop_codon:yes gene_type:complete